MSRGLLAAAAFSMILATVVAAPVPRDARRHGKENTNALVKAHRAELRIDASSEWQNWPAGNAFDDQPVTSCPASCTVPAVGARSPESRLVSVDLPAPLGPITAWMRSRQRSSVTSFTAARPPKRLVSCLAPRRTSAIAVLAAQHALDQAQDAARREADQQDDEQAHP